MKKLESREVKKIEEKEKLLPQWSKQGKNYRNLQDHLKESDSSTQNQ